MKCYDYALKYIYKQPKTEQDLRIKLFQKGFSSEEVYQAMETLKKQKFIGDEMFAQMYINSEVIRKGKPLMLITKKLQLRGIPPDIIKKITQKDAPDISEGIHERIKKEIENYKKKEVEGFEIIQKLMRKGYKLDDIKFVITQ
jgi:regulatory protein